MKKLSKVILIVLLISVTITTALLTGCQRLTPEEGFEALQSALANTLTDDNDHIFYWKESISTPRAGLTNLVETTTVNVLCSIDRDYNFVKYDESKAFGYEDLKARITKSYDGKSVYELFCGVSKDGNSYLATRGALDSTTPLTNDFKVAENKYSFQDRNAEEYVQSAEFAPYTLEAKLAELKSLKKEDIVIDKVEKKGNVTTITCKMSDAYCAKYLEDNGAKSVLEGKYVTIELSYNRIAAIIVYQTDPGADESNTQGILALEYESYKFEIVYTGPKFNVPEKLSTNSK